MKNWILDEKGHTSGIDCVCGPIVDGDNVFHQALDACYAGKEWRNLADGKNVGTVNKRDAEEVVESHAPRAVRADAARPAASAAKRGRHDS